VTVTVGVVVTVTFKKVTVTFLDSHLLAFWVGFSFAIESGGLVLIWKENENI